MNDDLGDFLKSLERSYNHMPNNESYIYMRIDGRGFSKLTRGMEKPCDKSFMNDLHDMCEDLMKEFGADLVFHQSDEISLVWKPVSPPTERVFGGNFNKLNSLVASHASVFLSMRLGKPCQFDARVVEVSRENLLKFLWWRYKDCTRNAISMTASCLYSEKQLSGVSTTGRLEWIKDNALWTSQPGFFKYGFWLTRERNENDRSYLLNREATYFPLASNFFAWMEEIKV